jgi:hypothetical protein
MDLQSDQSSEAEMVEDELTNRSVLLSSDNRDVDEFINILVHLIHDSESRLVGNELTNR